jgi:N-acyl-D-amino-acid deacylase
MRNDHPFDLIIEGGTLIDGSKAPRYRADLGIIDGRISALGDLSACQANQRIDATGKVVAPGFIDSHTHDDQAVLSQPDMTFKVSQGVTTVVTGNCGISIAPLRQDSDLPSPLNLLDDTDSTRFSTFKGYLDALRQSPSAVNVAAMVGHSTLRVMTMDSLERAADLTEIGAMQALLDEALAAGARPDPGNHRRLQTANRQWRALRDTHAR